MTEMSKIKQAINLLIEVATDFQPAAFSTSYSVEDMIVTDLIYRYVSDIEIFTLDTGRIPEETYALAKKVKEKYGANIRSYFPDTEKLQEFVLSHGHNAFYESVDTRKLCCQIRKVEPLQRALSDKRAWVTGLRAQQSVTRAKLPESQWDKQFEIMKFNPLADWSHQDVWSYIYDNDIPYNDLYEEGYASIGCEPCTRAITVGEDIRAGRWWWENPESKECGLHCASKAGIAESSETAPASETKLPHSAATV